MSLSKLSEWVTSDKDLPIKVGVGVVVIIATAGIVYRKCYKPSDLSQTPLDQSYDYIVVGGGSAGCVVAARLSEDPTKKVLLLEAGPETPPLTGKIPIGCTELQLTDVDWQYKSTPGYLGRVSFWPRGKVLGGSSVLNNMLYVRGHAADYDLWAKNGCSGWSYQDVLEYFRKSEDFEKGSNKYRGQGGPLKVSFIRQPTKAATLWVEAAVAAGFKLCEDFNGADQEGVNHSQTTIRNGERESTYTAYIKPVLSKRNNLTVRTHVHVMRLSISEKRAKGVLVKLQNGEEQMIYASKEVILSAGAIGSPHILMLSGIGPKEHLEKHGLICFSDLPVGENLQDHLFVAEPYKTHKLIGFSQGDKTIWNLLRWLLFRSGPLASPLAEAMAFIKTRPSEPVPDCQLHFIPAIPEEKTFERFNLKHRKVQAPHGISTFSTLLRPKSIGSVRLSSDDPFAHPVIQTNYLEHEDDVRVMVEGLKAGRKIHQHEPLKSILEPLTVDDIPHPWESDDYLIEFVKRNATTVYHPVGTCKMGAEGDPTAVVNPRLQVKGIKGLRVIDASVMPWLIGGNTNAPAIMIGEKGADLIKQDN